MGCRVKNVYPETIGALFQPIIVSISMFFFSSKPFLVSTAAQFFSNDRYNCVIVFIATTFSKPLFSKFVFFIFTHIKFSRKQSCLETMILSASGFRLRQNVLKS